MQLNSHEEIQILHVDDDPSITDLTGTFLERDDERFTVETAASADEGLENITDCPPDCVVSDYNMPGIDGLEFLQAVREEYPDLPFILFTGKGSETVASDAIAADVTGYLQKSSRTEQYELLANRIRTVVGQYRAERELERQNDLFEKAQDLADVGAWEWNPEEETGYYTDHVYEIYGVRPGYKGSPQADIERFYHPDDRDTIRNAIENAIEAGDDYDITVRVTAADGTQKWVRTRGGPQFEDGTCKRVRGTIQDITERKEREQRIETQRQQLEDLLNATRTLITADTRDDIAARASETVREVIDLPLNGIYLYDPAQHALVPAVVTDPVKQALGDPPIIGPGDGVAWTAYETGEPQIYTDIREAPEAMNPDTPVRSECHFPIGEHGVLVAASTTPDDFTDTDITSAKILANNLKVAFSQKRRERQLTELNQASKEFLRAETDREIAEIGVRAAKQILDLQANAVHLATADETQLMPVAHTDEAESLTGNIIPLPVDGSTAGRVYQHGETTVVEDVRQDPDVYDSETDLRGHAYFPLADHGVLIAGSEEQAAFDEQGIALGELLAGNLVAAFDRIDRVEGKRELERTERRYRALLEHTHDAIARVKFDNDTPVVREASPEFKSLFEPPDESVVGKDIDEVVASEENFETAREISLQTREGESMSGETTRETVDGTRDFIWQSIPIQDPDTGESDGGFAIYTDITERKEREESLNALQKVTREFMNAQDKQAVAEQAVETARSVLDQPINGLWLQDSDEKVLQPVAMTAESVEVVGAPPTYSGGESLSWEAFSANELRIYDNVRTHPDRLNSETPIRSEIILPLGEHGVMNIGATEPATFSEIDVSLARIFGKTVEGALDRADREQRLRNQRSRLQQQNDRLDKFTGVVSHDLQNPLHVADGKIKLAQQECESAHLAEAEDALARMETLIEDLLTIAREGTEVQETEPTRLEVLAEDSWGGVETDEATLQNGTEHTIQADPSRLRQLLENLIRNAVDHGGEDVTVRTGELEDGFYVADDGPGIPAEERDEVFEVGYSTTAEGTGFGLNIVEEIVEAHGWEISVTDSDDGGARIEITGVTIEE